jgi:superfamily II DNA or RNA helicase
MSILRPYQQKAIDELYAAWDAGARNVCVQLATGAGKTVIFSHVIADEPEISVAIAHRVELVSQISLTLARHGVRHNIIAPTAAIRSIVALHMQELGRAFYDGHARRHVAGVDTLVKMREPWFTQVALVVQDEGHHPLRENKWGKAAALFPNARGLYPTATPCRADGKGLGRNADGIIDKLIVGVGMRELIREGYLTDYRIFAPPSDLDLSAVPVTATGDYSPPKLRNAIHKSHITGDVVSHYMRIAPGKLGVTFAVDIESATAIATEFKAAGVSAEVISSKTPDALRAAIMQRFKRREIMQLVNVDLLGEGFDCPAIEVVSFARPTQSFSLYSQQFGRSLRPLEGKEHAIIIDHVNNVIRHGLPDRPRVWSLERRERKARSAPDDAIPLRVCLNPSCMAVYPRTRRGCPVCGHVNIPVARSTPEQVDGDLLELDPDVLAQMRGEIERVDGAPRVPQHLDAIAQKAVINRHKARQQAQSELRQIIALWAGYRRHAGLSDSEIYREFYFTFDIDVMGAQALKANDADNLWDKIQQVIDGFSNMK